MKSNYLNIKTQRKYLAFASGFYKKWMPDGVITSSRVLKALHQAAPEYRPGSFRVLKNAIAFDQEEKGYKSAAKKILDFKNPITALGSDQKPKPKTKKMKSCGELEFWLLADSLREKGFQEESASLILAWFCGVRPCEMRSIYVDDVFIYISGGKKSHGGLRGADRVFEVEDGDVLALIEYCANIMRATSRSSSTIRDRIRFEAKELWPRRKITPTLYSLRHQFGANLKAAKVDDKIMSYLMGHQSTRSIEVYGDRRVGDSSLVKVKPANNTSSLEVRRKTNGKKLGVSSARAPRRMDGAGLHM